jgi:hypothetical protein
MQGHNNNVKFYFILFHKTNSRLGEISTFVFFNWAKLFDANNLPNALGTIILNHPRFVLIKPQFRHILSIKFCQFLLKPGEGKIGSRC